ncbi:MAG: pyridoxine 5'-phosphate synthase [Endomicrobiales bacterium]|nr:pyridoxine 5'-phosphate synthase [Endomicrobiales bacterium]
MIKLGVNIDHIATLRQARKEGHPDLIKAALLCEKAGAGGITVHLREDRRHVQDGDVKGLRVALKTKLNLEMSAAPEIVRFALAVGPDDVCVVPEKRQELTTEGGLDVAGQKKKIRGITGLMKSRGIRVSLFIDPDPAQVKAAADVGADCVELHTGKYALYFGTKKGRSELERIKKAGRLAVKRGLLLNAGHGLNYENVRPVAKIPGMQELNIGFSIISRSVFVGIEKAVREMNELVKGKR